MKYRSEKKTQKITTPEECFTQSLKSAKDKAKKKASRSAKQFTNRKKQFNDDIEEACIRSVSYRCDTTRYRCYPVETSEIIMDYAFPSILLLLVVFSIISVVVATQTQDLKDYRQTIINDLDTVTLAEYKTYIFVHNLSEWITNDRKKKTYNCKGLIRGRESEVTKYDIEAHRKLGFNVTKGIVSRSYVWMKPSEFKWKIKNCPPSMILELESK